LEYKIFLIRDKILSLKEREFYLVNIKVWKMKSFQTLETRYKNGQERLFVTRALAYHILVNYENSSIVGGAPRDFLVQDYYASRTYEILGTEQVRSFRWENKDSIPETFIGRNTIPKDLDVLIEEEIDLDCIMHTMLTTVLTNVKGCIFTQKTSFKLSQYMPMQEHVSDIYRVKLNYRMGGLTMWENIPFQIDFIVLKNKDCVQTFLNNIPFACDTYRMHAELKDIQCRTYGSSKEEGTVPIWIAFNFVDIDNTIITKDSHTHMATFNEMLKMTTELLPEKIRDTTHAINIFRRCIQKQILGWTILNLGFKIEERNDKSWVLTLTNDNNENIQEFVVYPTIDHVLKINETNYIYDVRYTTLYCKRTGFGLTIQLVDIEITD